MNDFEVIKIMGRSKDIFERVVSEFPTDIGDGSYWIEYDYGDFGCLGGHTGFFVRFTVNHGEYDDPNFKYKTLKSFVEVDMENPDFSKIEKDIRNAFRDKYNMAARNIKYWF